MKSALNNGWKWLLGGVLTLLGFTSCEEGFIDIGGGEDMYGVPSARYKVIGDVKNSSGNPVKGIRVVVSPNPYNHRADDTLYTDEKGHFEKDPLRYKWPDDLVDVIVEFADVDGAENGSYRKKELKRSDLSVKQMEREGRDGWYSGAFTYTADAVLDEEE